jgi:hypothetical protein
MRRRSLSGKFRYQLYDPEDVEYVSRDGNPELACQAEAC